MRFGVAWSSHPPPCAVTRVARRSSGSSSTTTTTGTTCDHYPAMPAAWSPELRPGSSPPATSRRARFWEVPQKGQHPHPRRGSDRHTAAGTATTHTPGGAATPQEGQRRHAPQAGQRQLTPQEGQQTRTHRQGDCPFCRVCLQPYACVRRHLATARSGPRAVRAPADLPRLTRRGSR